ncbi:MAG: hypothetical protein Tsb004_09020 [Allomuricauda sp.]
MKIKIGEYEVYSDGTIISLPNEPVKFFIEDLTFELVFKDNKEVKGQNVEAKPFENNKGITLIFTNFNNSLGTGNVQPLPLGFLNNKTLYFNYRIYALNGEPDKGETGKTIHYTWLTKERKEGENG